MTAKENGVKSYLFNIFFSVARIVRKNQVMTSFLKEMKRRGKKTKKEGVLLTIQVYFWLLKIETIFLYYSGIQELISFVSKHIELLPGDVILTGTPAGLGVAK